MRAALLACILFIGCAASTQPVLSEKEVAEFKTAAAAHIWERVDWCPVTEEPSLLALYEAVQRRSEEFLNDIRGTELEEYYRQAKEEWKEDWGEVEVECADPVGIEGKVEVEQAVAEYEEVMDQLEGFVDLVEERSPRA